MPRLFRSERPVVKSRGLPSRSVILPTGFFQHQRAGCLIPDFLAIIGLSGREQAQQQIAFPGRQDSILGLAVHQDRLQPGCPGLGKDIDLADIGVARIRRSAGRALLGRFERLRAVRQTACSRLSEVRPLAKPAMSSRCPGRARRSPASRGRSGRAGGRSPGWGSPARRFAPGHPPPAPGRRRTGRRARSLWCRRSGPGSRSAPPNRRVAWSIQSHTAGAMPVGREQPFGQSGPQIESPAPASGRLRVAQRSRDPPRQPAQSCGKACGQQVANQRLGGKIGHGNRRAIVFGQGRRDQLGLHLAHQQRGRGVLHSGQIGFPAGVSRIMRHEHGFRLLKIGYSWD